MGNTYPFSLKPLPYPYDDLIPQISEQTLCFHHDKHLKTYVDNLNNTIKDYPEAHGKTVKELLMNLDRLPENIRTPVKNNGGGVYNHELYFSILGEMCSTSPSPALLCAINRDFGSIDGFKEALKAAALSQFGSGWAWLLSDKEKKLSIVKTPNQDTPDLSKYTPLLLCDVWEHAYYLDYQNRRADYVDAFFKILDYERISRNYEIQI